MKKISVIIPCYNSKDYLKECLSSVECQTIGMDTLEVICVNDASTDQTLGILEQFEAKYPESVLVIDLDQNGGQGTARNIGLQYATGEYIAFLDSDDFIDPGLYRETYELAAKNDLDIVQFAGFNFAADDKGEYRIFDHHYNERLMGLVTVENPEERRRFLANKTVHCECKTKIYKRSLVEQAGVRFAEGLIYEEPAFVYPLLFYVTRVYGYPEGKYYVRNHRASTMHKSAKTPGKLYEHPKVQLLTCEFVKATVADHELYRQEIDFYFLFTYYIETLYFAKQGNLLIECGFFGQMQETARRMVPGWRENIYLNQPENADLFKIVSTVEEEYDQEKLDRLIASL